MSEWTTAEPVTADSGWTPAQPVEQPKTVATVPIVEKKKPTFLEGAIGAGETALNLVTGIGAMTEAPIAQVLTHLKTGDYETGRRVADTIRNEFTYQPRTEYGKWGSEKLVGPILGLPSILGQALEENPEVSQQFGKDFPIESLRTPIQHVASRIQEAGTISRDIINTTGVGKTVGDIAQFGLEVAGYGPVHKGVSKVTSLPKELLNRRRVAQPEAITPVTEPTGTNVLTDKIETPTTTQTNRRQRALAKDIIEKQADQVQLADVLNKQKEEDSLGPMVIPDTTGEVKTEVAFENLNLTAEQKAFVEQQVKELGDPKAVRELYKTDSAVDVYARTLAGMLEAKTQTVRLSDAEFKQLEDTKVFTPEELEALKKAPAIKQREQYNRTFPPEVKATPDDIAKAQTIASKVEQYAQQTKTKRRDIATLREAEWSDEDIVKMSDDEVSRKASVIRGEVNPLNPTEDTIVKLSEAEKELKSFREELGTTPLDQLTPEQEARHDALLQKLSDELGLDEEIIGAFKNPPMLSDKDLYDISNKVHNQVEGFFAQGGKDWTPAEKVNEDVNTKPLNRAEEIAKWNEQLANEGMPDEIDFSENEKATMNSFDRKQADSEKPKTNKQASEEALARVNSALNNRRNVYSNTEARNLLVDVYKIMPRNAKELADWKDKVIKVENLVQGKVEHKRNAFSRKAISDALNRGEITKEQAKYMNTILNTLKQQPTFGFEIASSVGSGRSGLYTFAKNLLEISDPNALAHETGHFVWDNLLTKEDRLAYVEHFANNFYDAKGNIVWSKLTLDSTNPFNAVRNPAETFACKLADYMHDKVLSPTELSLFTKVKSWYSQLKDRLIALSGNTKYTEVEAIFNKVLDPANRRVWTEGQSEPAVIEPTLGYESAFNEKKVWHGTRSFFDKYLGKVDEVTKPKEITLDSIGLQSMCKRIAELKKVFTKAKADDQGRKILAEVKGDDWGLASEVTRGTLFSTDNTTVSQRLWRNLGPWIESPMSFVKGTRNERHVYNTNLAEMFISHMYDQHRTTIDTILHEMKKGTGNPENVRKVIEGKIEGTPAEKVAAEQVRGWLDTMKNRYKLYSINEYKANLNKREYSALLDLVSGTDIETVKTRNPKLATDVIEEIAEKYKEIDSWGIDNYIPNVESGRFKIIVDATTADGKPYKKLVAIGLSEKDAVRKATKYLEENPDVKQLYVDTDYKMISDDKTSITRGQYYGMMNSLAKKMLESIDGIDKGVAKEMARKTLQRKFKIVPTDSYSPFLEARQDILKGEEDIFPVLRSYAHSMEKKMALDPVIDIIRKDIPKMNKYERDYILKYIEDVKGRYGAADKMVDDIFQTYRGYSRLVSRARTTEANLKLGYRPIAAGINLASGQMHVWVKRGAPAYAEGIKFLSTEEGKKFIKDVEPFLGTSIIDIGTELQSNVPKWKPLGMFQMAEPFNREVSTAVAYQQALKNGMSELAAKEFAIRANWAEQFTYNMANLPQIMRGPTGKLITQFKPYLIKEIEFMSTLSGKEWLRYAGMQLALGGPRGYLMIMKTLPILALFGFWQEVTDTVEEWMNKEVPLASRGIGGLPGNIKPNYAFDMSAAATFQFPTGPADFLGPFISDLVNIKKNVLDPLTTVGPYKEDLAKSLNVAPIIRHWHRLMDYTFSKDNWIRDDKGNKLYEVPEAAPFIIQSLMGVENADLNRVKAEEGILSRRQGRSNEIKTRIINQVVQLSIDGKPIPNELREQIKKNGVTVESLVNRVQQTHLPPRTRAILNTELRRRMETMEMFPTDSDYSEQQVAP